MISAHSHSGQFCRHASDNLELIVLRAIELGFSVYCLTEHMPRYYQNDLYPEELEHGMTVEDLSLQFDAFFKEAKRLKQLYSDRIRLLIGTEIEWIHADSHQRIIELQEKYPLDLVVGSVHHVDGIPIDFSREMFSKIVDPVDKYFDQQYDMLVSVRPTVVAHFDLVRLYGDIPRSGDVLDKIDRNIKFIRDNGLLVEINSRGIRKQGECYPSQWILDRMAGCRFTTSDDCHAIADVGSGYTEMHAYLQMNGITDVYSPDGQVSKLQIHSKPRHLNLLQRLDNQGKVA